MEDQVPAPADDDNVTQIPIDEPLPGSDVTPSSEPDVSSELEDPPWLQRVKAQDAERKANYKPWYLPETEQTVAKIDVDVSEAELVPTVVINDDDPDWLKRAKEQQKEKQQAQATRKSQPLTNGGAAPLPILFALLLLLLKLFGDFQFYWPAIAEKLFGTWDALQPQQFIAPTLENQPLLLDAAMSGGLTVILPIVLMVFVLNRKLWARFGYVIAIVGALVLLENNLRFNLVFNFESVNVFLQTNWLVLRNILPIASAVLVMLPAVTPWFIEHDNSAT